ncbi:MAG: hypothetical protein ACYDHG_13340 [Desulfomonilaceae bacterium]
MGKLDVIPETFRVNDEDLHVKMNIMTDQKEGMRICHIPFGFALGTDGETLVPVPREQQA